MRFVPIEEDTEQATLEPKSAGGLKFVPLEPGEKPTEELGALTQLGRGLVRGGRQGLAQIQAMPSALRLDALAGRLQEARSELQALEQAPGAERTDLPVQVTGMPGMRERRRAQLIQQLQQDEALQRDIVNAFRDYQRQAQQAGEGSIEFTDAIQGKGGFLEWLGQSIGQGAAYIVPLVAAGMVPVVGPGLAAGGVIAMNRADIVGQRAEDQTMYGSPGLARPAAIERATQDPERLTEQIGREQAAIGAATAGYSALDFFLGPVGRVIGRGMGRKAAERALADMSKSQVVVDILKETGKQSVEEFINEAGQEGISILMEAALDAGDIATAENAKRLLNAGAAGAAAGGVAGGAMRAAAAVRPPSEAVELGDEAAKVAARTKGADLSQLVAETAEDGTTTYRTPSGDTITKEQWDNAGRRLREAWLRPRGNGVDRETVPGQAVPEVRGGERPTEPSVLPSLPRRVYAELEAVASSDVGTEAQGQLQELRRRVQEAGETEAAALRAVFGRGYADASPELRPAIERALDVQGLPSRAAQVEPIEEIEAAPPPKSERVLELERLAAEAETAEARKELEAQARKQAKKEEDEFRREQEADDLMRLAARTKDEEIAAGLRARALKLRGVEEKTEAEKPATRGLRVREGDVEQIEAKPVEEPTPEEVSKLAAAAAEEAQAEPVGPARVLERRPESKEVTKGRSASPLLAGLQAAGGISEREMSDMGIEKKTGAKRKERFVTKKGKVVERTVDVRDEFKVGKQSLFRKDGKLRMDAVAEWLHQRGYLADESDHERARELIRRELEEPGSIRPLAEAERDMIARAERERDEAQQQEIIDEARALGIETEGRPFEDVRRALVEALDRDWTQRAGMPIEAIESASLVRRAADIDEDAVQDAAVRFGDDEAGFLRAVQEIIDAQQEREVARGRQAAEPAPDQAGRRPEAGRREPRAAAPEPARQAAVRGEQRVRAAEPGERAEARPEQARPERPEAAGGVGEQARIGESEAAAQPAAAAQGALARAQESLRARFKSPGMTLSAADPGNRRALGRRQAIQNMLAEGIVRDLARDLGLDVKVVWYEQSGGPTIDGFSPSYAPDTIFMNVRARSPAINAIGHEFLHWLRKNHPDDYAFFARSIVPALRNIPEHRRALNEKYRAAGGEELTVEGAFEELLADIWGDAISDRRLYQELAQRDPEGFRSFAERVLAFFDRLLDAISGGRGPVAQQFVADVQAARKAVADTLVQMRQRGAAERELTQRVQRQQESLSLQERRPIFYSELARQVEAIPARAMPASDWISRIAALKGVKPDEIEWSGVREWLQMQSGKVTKDQVLDYLRANGVRVHEVELGGAQAQLEEAERDLIRHLIDNEAFTERGAREYALDAARGDLTEAQHENQSETTRRLSNRVRDLYVQRDEEGSAAQTKYSSYQLPGGENYTELLLTLPVGKPTQTGLAARKAVFDRYQPEIDALRRKLDESRSPSDLLQQLNELEQQRDREADAVYRLPEDRRRFMSGHWNEPNIVAHVRFNERKAADGKRVLFIEEIQSDWAQRGRERGFAEDEPRWPVPGLRLERYQGFDAHRFPWMVRVGQRAAVGRTEQEAIDNAIHMLQSDSGLPRAPFVEKTEQWVSLVLKRMIRWAAENGFDRIAWTTGEQQADRYDLRKQIDHIEYRQAPPSDDTYDIAAVDKDGIEVINESGIKLSRIEELVGKELAQKIANGEGQRGGGRMTLRGLDLQVGGEGMKTFYDQIVPNVANDVLRKLGGGRVDSSVIPVTRMSEDELRQAARQENNKNVAEVLGFDITAELRGRALGGLPMFAIERTAEGKQPQRRVTEADLEAAGADAKKMQEHRIRVDQAIKDFLGERAFTWMESNGLLRPMWSWEDENERMRADTGVPGYFEKAGPPRAIFYYDRIEDVSRIPELIVHEIGVHFGLERMLGGEQYRTLLQQVRELKQRGDMPFVEAWERVKRDYIDARGRPYFDEGSDLFVEEVIASVVQTYPKDSFVRRLLAQIRAWVAQNISPRLAGKLDESLLKGLAVSALRRAGRGELSMEPTSSPERAVADIMMSRAGRSPPPRDVAVTHASVVNKWLDFFNRHFLDSFSQLKKRQLEKVKGQLGDSLNAYAREQLMHGRVTERLKDIGTDYLTPIIKIAGEAELTREDVADGLYAMHAPEANAYIASINPAMPDAGSGMSNAVAKQILASFTSQQRKALDEIMAIVQKMNRAKLDRMVDEGLITSDQRATLLKRYKYWLSLKQMSDEETFGLSGPGLSVKGREFQARMGRYSQAEDPLSMTVRDAMLAILRAEKNRVAKSFLEFVRAHPDPALWEEVRPANYPTQRVMDPQTGEVKTVPDPLALWREPEYFGAKVEGEQKWVRIKDALLAEQMKRLGDHGLDSDNELVHAVIRAVNGATRLLSRFYTQLSPDFALVNPIRDVQQGLLVATGFDPKKGKQLAARMFKNLPSALRDAAIANFQEGIQGKHPTGLYEQFRQDGGTTGGFGLDDARTIQKEMERAIAALNGDKRAKATMTVQAMLKPIMALNDSFENMSRFAVYKAALESGFTREQAAVMAKNVTVNFNKRGQATPVLNALYAFFNAALQANVAATRAVMRSRIAQVASAGLFAAGVLAALSDEEDERGMDESERVSEFVADRNLVFPIGERKAIKIPLAYGFNIPYATGRHLVRVLQGKESTAHMLGAILKLGFTTFLPTDSPVPTVAQPIADVMTGEDFAGRRIAKENPFDSVTPKSSQYRENANAAAVAFFKALNAATGGSEFTRGAIDVSPEKATYLVKQYLGGLAAPLEMVALPFAEKTTVADIPVARRFVAEAKEDIYVTKAARIIREAEARRKEIEAGAQPNPGEEEYVYTVRAYESALRRLASARAKMLRENKKADVSEIDEQRNLLADQVLTARRAFQQEAR